MAITKIVTPPGEKSEIKLLSVYFQTTAAAMDTNIQAFLGHEKAIHIVDAWVVFQALDTFASGVDIDLETDDGTTETAIANYDTVGGASATAIDTVYSFTFTGARKVAAGTRLQVRVDDDEDAACWGQVFIQYVELND